MKQKLITIEPQHMEEELYSWCKNEAKSWEGMGLSLPRWIVLQLKVIREMREMEKAQLAKKKLDNNKTND